VTFLPLVVHVLNKEADLRTTSCSPHKLYTPW